MANLFPLGAQLEFPLGDRDRYVTPNKCYHFPLTWKECERAPGDYILPPSAYDTVNRLKAKLPRDKYKLIIGIRSCPAFYAMYPDHPNSPPKIEHASKLADFMRYVKLVLNPDGFEIFNEPEFPMGSPHPYLMGGYGPDGGNLYGSFLKELYANFKSTHGQTSVIAGASYGLLEVDNALQFLKDAVIAGMRADYYSWHAYWYYADVYYADRDFYQALWYSLRAHDLFPVPQIISETSVIRMTELPEDTEHRNRQKTLLEFYLKYMQRHPIESVWWYALANNKWKHSDMIADNVVYPVYSVWVNN